jgi:hypothetical protein
VTPKPPPPQALAIRPFFLITGQQFAATRTFEAAFDTAFQPFFGGGVELVFNGDLFIDATVSRFSKTGQRAFLTSTTAYKLGEPLDVSVTPIEFTAGYRFRQVSRTIVPYIGGGIGSYGYSESSPPPYSDSSENVDQRGIGYLLVGGVDMRVHRWVSVAVDGQYSRVTGILGEGGLSKAAGEDDLGGVAIRARVLIGK